MKQTTNQILLYINNSGAGWADCLDVPEGQSVEKLVHERMPGRQLEDFLIRVNRQPVRRDTVLQQGDRVTIAPLQIEGAKI
ncbi:MAG: MoaD/ThiS family protein [Planctomycetota bacterium]|jgi:sulfur carrier protein ThiS